MMLDHLLILRLAIDGFFLPEEVFSDYVVKDSFWNYAKYHQGSH